MSEVLNVMICNQSTFFMEFDMLQKSVWPVKTAEA